VLVGNTHWTLLRIAVRSGMRAMDVLRYGTEVGRSSGTGGPGLTVRSNRTGKDNGGRAGPSLRCRYCANVSEAEGRTAFPEGGVD
jgi:hypothetical protein